MKGKMAILALCSSVAVGLASESMNPAANLIGKFRNTHYYVVMESDFKGEPIDSIILNMQEEILVRVNSKFKRAMDIEGTGKLIDGRVLNFAGRKNGQIRYRFTQSSWGDGIGTCQLVPFHTVAVDPRRISVGSLVQIDETLGMLLPDGSRHDGLWRAEDVGSAIQGDRIDLFVGEGGNIKILEAAGITILKPLTVRLVNQPPSDSCVNAGYEE
jgi:3D (Asp-Asp-Asp) domain-containing protein